MEKKYSVLMSVYYKEKSEYLRESIESMINQTLPPHDFVIVKDGKLTKELEEVILLYKNRYPNLFNIVGIEKNVGLGRALNEGIRHCRCELIARMDSDDISLPTRCEKQIALFNAHPSYSIIGTFIDEFYDNSNNVVSSRIVPMEHQDIVNFSKRRNPFNHPTVMYKKSDVINCGYYRTLPGAEDLDLFSKMLHSGCKAANIGESLVLYRANENNFLRRKSWNYCKAHISAVHASWKRNYCTLIDLSIVTIVRLAVFLSPVGLLKVMSNRHLRELK